jgi:hypothetical protein
MPGVEVFERQAERYDAWFERHPHHYEAELRALRALMPKVSCGIELGVVSLMRKIGYKAFEFRQTIFPPTKETERAVPVEEGHGPGLFVVIKANK